MRRPIWSLLLVVIGTMTVGMSQPTSARAGILADTWWALFGPAGTPYFPGASGYRYQGYGYPVSYSSYYRGGYCQPVRTYYPPANCCQPCNPCTTSGSSCAGRPCQISDGGGAPPSTFKNDGDPPTPMKDSNFKSRKEDDKKTFKPTSEKKKKEDPGFPLPNKKDENGTATQRKALKPPVPSGGDGNNQQDDESNKKQPNGDSKNSVIRKKKPAPAKSPVGPKTRSEKTQAVSIPFDRIRLDGKITWRTPQTRSRLVIHPTLPATTVSRRTFPLNNGWKPVRNAGPRLVKK